MALFFLAPLVGEFLLGNLPITFLAALMLLAPLYGGGAILIRETARRFDFTWTGIVILGLAYGVIEETFVTQSLFNPNYIGLRLLDYGYIPALGMSAWWTVFVLSLHTIWSTAVPIAMMETLSVRQRRTPWLGRVGLVITTVLFLAGCAILMRFEYKKGFIASPAQFIGSAVAVGGLIALAFGIGRNKPGVKRAVGVGNPPTPLRVGLTAFTFGAAFFALMKAKKSLPPTPIVAGMVVLWAAAAALNLMWSRRIGWREKHRLALTAGFLLTYTWYGFVQVPSVGNVSAKVALIGNVIFATGAVLLLWKAISVVKREG